MSGDWRASPDHSGLFNRRAVVFEVLLDVLVPELDGIAGEADQSGGVCPVEEAGRVVGESTCAVKGACRQ
jgi:hypothetical protein